MDTLFSTFFGNTCSENVVFVLYHQIFITNNLTYIHVSWNTLFFYFFWKHTGESTMVINKTMLKMYLWYDNEYGYSCRMYDLLTMIIEKGI